MNMVVYVPECGAMVRKAVWSLIAVYVLGSAVWLAAGGVRRPSSTELLNVSCDPTRELWRDINEQFIERYEQERGVRLTIRMSHGGSASQARSVIDGLVSIVGKITGIKEGDFQLLL